MNNPMSRNAEDMGSSDNSQSRFCALEYRPKDWSAASTGASPPILLALRDEEGQLRLLVHHELISIVQAEDWDYVQSLLRDFKERAQRDAATLFKQLTTLSVGPLVTRLAGAEPMDCPELAAHISTYVKL